MKNKQHNFCQHGFTYGFCPEKCIRYTNVKELRIGQRKEFLKLWSNKDWHNPITKKTILMRLHEFDMQIRYPLGVPKNLVSKVQ